MRPDAVLHLGLAEGRARLALEWIAVNLLDYPIPDNAGHRATGEPCVPDGPPAYLSTLPFPAMQGLLAAAGIPAYLSTTAGTYLCNQVLYTTLHALATRRLAGPGRPRPRAAPAGHGGGDRRGGAQHGARPDAPSRRAPAA